METQGSVAIGAPWAEPRRRKKTTVLVIGDARVRALADAARARHGWTVTSFDPRTGSPVTEAGDEVVIEANSFDQVRDEHPEILRQAGRVWVVTPDAVDGAAPNPFEHPLPPAGRVLKRAVDIALALIGLVAVLPVLLLAMGTIRFDSQGPALFRQVRIGLNGRRFRLYKLRTMHQNNDDRAHRTYVAQLIAGTGERRDDVYKLVDDPRITRVGRILRKLSIDELPQLWNVLKGDMSLVGPRPPLPHETELYPASAWDRLHVKPGITGLWQVSGRCELSFEDMVLLDVRYWQRWSFLSDVWILLKTPGTVLSRRGAA